jgi:hypothetical protein
MMMKKKKKKRERERQKGQYTDVHMYGRYRCE